MFAALFALVIFALSWFVFSVIAYGTIYSMFVFSYFCLWDDATRKEICPHGLWRAIFFDE